MAVTEEILVNVTPQETRVAVIEQGVTQEVHVERASARGLVGNIYMGKVVRVLPGMQSAFVDIGKERAAFLHVADIRGHRSGNGQAQEPIEKLLGEGQNLMVQVVKDPIGTKGARLSTQISVAGRYLVYLPQESRIGISALALMRSAARSCEGSAPSGLPAAICSSERWICDVLLASRARKTSRSSFSRLLSMVPPWPPVRARCARDVGTSQTPRQETLHTTVTRRRAPGAGATAGSRPLPRGWPRHQPIAAGPAARRMRSGPRPQRPRGR